LRQIIKTDWGQFVPAIFVDYANGWINHAPISMIGSNASNHMALSDAGLGVDWSGSHDFTASITWARRLPMSPAGNYNNGNANSQFWFLAQSRF
jgi:hemolysin activation/secretion protein